jgi:hypothetical protein
MGRPKKVTAPVETVITIDEQEDQEEQVELAENHILICNSKQTFGVVFKRGYVELYERTYFAEDTVVSAGARTVNYKAGDFGPWKLSSRPYPANWEQALRYVADWVAQDSLTEKEDFNCIIEVISESKKDVIDSLKGSISEYVTKIVPKK